MQNNKRCRDVLFVFAKRKKAIRKYDINKFAKGKNGKVKRKSKELIKKINLYPDFANNVCEGFYTINTLKGGYPVNCLTYFTFGLGNKIKKPNYGIPPYSYLFPFDSNINSFFLTQNIHRVHLFSRGCLIFERL